MDCYQREIASEQLWGLIVEQAERDQARLPLLHDFYQRRLLDHPGLTEALAASLAELLVDDPRTVANWQASIVGVLRNAPLMAQAARNDLLCQLRGNASIQEYYTPLLHFCGYQALQAHRLAHHFWQQGDGAMASYIQGRVVSRYGVDIHPAAQIGSGIFIDHAIGIVIGETAVVEDDATLFQGVTLGGTGKGSGDRHPKIRRGAFIGANASILGNIEIGAGARVGAGAVVTRPVAAYTTVVGSLASTVANRRNTASPSTPAV